MLELLRRNARKLLGQNHVFDPEAELKRAAELGIRVICAADPDYSALLKSIDDAPLVLYIKGRPAAEGLVPVAFVGSRRPTPYGRRMARRLGAEAARAGAVVVSGLARGIDTEAHRAALEAGGVTWAVLGSALNRLYPPENAALAGEIAAKGGCLISEFPLSTPGYAANFPRRNRIISGLSWATVVVEGEIHSGSLITARLAAEQGREVLAVPGPADSPLSAAPHRLISQGARLASGMEDIWQALPPALRPASSSTGEQTPQFNETPELRRKILECLGPAGVSLDELCSGLGLPMPRLTQELLEMELEDLVVPVEGQRYAKK